MSSPPPPPEGAPPRRRRRSCQGLVFGSLGGLLLLLLVFAAATVANRATSGDSIGELRRGDCFNFTNSPFKERAERVGCSASHTDEVAGVLTSPAGSDEAYPGRDGILELGKRECPPLVRDFLGLKPPAAADTFVFGPNEAAWDDGERSVVCSLREPSAARRTASYLDG